MNYKKYAAITLAAMMAASPAASLADYVPGKEIDPNVMSTRMAQSYTLTINGNAIENAAIYESEGHTMLPLRKICEALGYEVTWEEESKRIELIRLPHYITLTQGEDGYTFARTAPMQLGKATEVKEDVTYVPHAFVTDILHGELTMNASGEITITQTGEMTGTEEPTPDADINVPASMPETISEISEGTITVESSEWGTVILNISEETAITGADGEVITAADLMVGDMVEVEFGDVMGMSEPPVNNPVSITLLPALDPEMGVVAEEAQYIDLCATIVEVDTEAGQVTVLATGMEDDVLNYSVLNTGAPTIIRNDKGETLTLADLKAGDKIDARHSTMMTMSIPAQLPCFIIEVDTDGAEADFAADAELDYVNFFAETE